MFGPENDQLARPGSQLSTSSTAFCFDAAYRVEISACLRMVAMALSRSNGGLGAALISNNQVNVYQLAEREKGPVAALIEELRLCFV